MKKQMLIGLCISAACLYWVLRGIDPHSFLSAFHTADFRWLLAATGLYLIPFLFRALRWKGILQTIQPMSARMLLPVLFIGFMANNLLPLRMGEVVRAHLVGKAGRFSRSTGLASIVLERLADMICFLCIFIMVTLMIPFPPIIQKAAYGFGVSAMAGLLAIVALIWKGDAIAARLDRTPIPLSWAMRMQQLMLRFLEGLSVARDVRTLGLTLVYSIPLWFTEAFVIYLTAHAFLPHFTLLQSFFLLLFLGLSVALPQAPGYVGPFEFFGVMALALTGVSKDIALSIVLTLHALQFLVILTAGTVSMLRMGLTFRTALQSSASQR